MAFPKPSYASHKVHGIRNVFTVIFVKSTNLLLCLFNYIWNLFRWSMKYAWRWQWLRGPSNILPSPPPPTNLSFKIRLTKFYFSLYFAIADIHLTFQFVTYCIYTEHKFIFRNTTDIDIVFIFVLFSQFRSDPCPPSVLLFQLNIELSTEFNILRGATGNSWGSSDAII